MEAREEDRVIVKVSLLWEEEGGNMEVSLLREEEGVMWK